MATNDDFGEVLIEALEEAVAYKQGKLPGLRVDRYEESLVRPESEPRPRRKRG
jgi:hypothetical protein